MIASVLADQKTRRDTLFDYLIPAEFNLKKFSLVSVPFRQKHVRALVIGLKTHSKKALKSVKKPLSSGAVITTGQLKLAQVIADNFLSTKAETIFSFLPPLPQKDLKIIAGNAVPAAVRHRSQTTYLIGEFEARLSFFSQNLQRKNQNLLVVPTVLQITRVQKYLRRLRPDLRVLCWHSQIAANERAKIWQKVLSGAPIVVVGTRQALFLPWQGLSDVFLDEPGNFAYHNDQTPYYNARAVAHFLTKILGSKLYFGDSTPDLPAYLDTMRGLASIKRFALKQQVTPASSWDEYRQDPDIKKEWQNFFLKSRRLLVVGPWKNEARYFCQDCQAPSLNSHLCPNCRSTRLKQVGLTYQKIIRELKDLFPGVSISAHPESAASTQIFVADFRSPNNLPPIFDAAIFPYFDLMADFSLINWRAKLYRLVFSLKNLGVNEVILCGRNLNDDRFVQHLVRNEWRQFLTENLKERRRLRLPPYTKAVLAVAKAKSYEKAWGSLQTFLKSLDQLATVVNLEDEAAKAKALLLIEKKNWPKLRTLARELPSNLHLEVDPAEFSP